VYHRDGRLSPRSSPVSSFGRLSTDWLMHL
jgi:hypothetical protein